MVLSGKLASVRSDAPCSSSEEGVLIVVFVVERLVTPSSRSENGDLTGVEVVERLDTCCPSSEEEFVSQPDIEAEGPALEF